MMEVHIKPLQPLSGGVVVLVGAKASNFDEEIRNHPRVVMWDSQHEHWTNKDLPANARAVFMTRFVSHAAFSRILKQVRQRHITLFNSEGTGTIARQIRELLNITTVQETTMAETKKKSKFAPKLHALHHLVDLNKSNIENARSLMNHANSMGIETTLGSLQQMVSHMRVKARKATREELPPHIERVKRQKKEADVSVQMFDDALKALKDIRQLVVDTANENQALRERVKKFKKLFDEI